jgi:glycosyltransferase involved in cell wall biosynthesis
MHKISILTLTYNHEKYIAECINSILLQDISVEVEILVGNDCSTDRTADILKEIKKVPHNFSMKVFNHKDNQGVARNFCRLMEEVTGEYIVFLDGDDFMLPGKLKAQLDILNNDPEINLVHHNVCEVNEASSVTKENKIKKGVSGSINDLLKACQSGIQSCSIVVRNPYVVDWSAIVPKESKVVDLPFLLYSVGKGKVFYIKDTLSAYRVINTSITRTTSVLAFEKNTRFHVRQLLAFDYVPNRYINTSISASFIRSAKAEIKSRNYKSSALYVKKAMLLLPYPSYQLLRTMLNFVKSIVTLEK